jgi:hypothetical protein
MATQDQRVEGLELCFSRISRSEELVDGEVAMSLYRGLRESEALVVGDQSVHISFLSFLVYTYFHLFQRIKLHVFLMRLYHAQCPPSALKS